jgi:hypothetical protein
LRLFGPAVFLTARCVQAARIDCLVSPLYRKRKLMTPMEAKEVLGMCVGECKRQAVEATKLNVRAHAKLLPVQLFYQR